MIWIFRKLRNAYARGKLKCLGFNNDEHEDINQVFEQFLAWDWDDVSWDTHYIRIFIHDHRTCFRFWSSNKYYGYASEGNVQHEDNVIFEWQDKRPSAWNIYKMEQKLQAFKIRQADITLTERIERLHQNRITRTSIFNSSIRPPAPPPPPPSANRSENRPGSNIFLVHKVNKMHEEIQKIK